MEFPPPDAVPHTFVDIIQKSFKEHIEDSDTESKRDTSGKREYKERRAHGAQNSVTYAFGDTSKTSFLQDRGPLEILPMITWKPAS